MSTNLHVKHFKFREIYNSRQLDSRQTNSRHHWVGQRNYIVMLRTNTIS